MHGYAITNYSFCVCEVEKWMGMGEGGCTQSTPPPSGSVPGKYHLQTFNMLRFADNISLETLNVAHRLLKRSTYNSLIIQAEV